MADRIRIWITRRLLGAAWIILPRWHPAYRGIFDAAVAIRDGSTPTSGVPIHSGNTTSGETPITNVSAGTAVLIERGEI